MCKTYPLIAFYCICVTSMLHLILFFFKLSLQNSPDIQFLGESKFADRCKKLCSKSDEIYNSSNNLSTSTQDFNSTGGKIPIHGPRRVLILARHATYPFVTEIRRFPITDEEICYYIVFCRLADSSKWQRY